MSYAVSTVCSTLPAFRRSTDHEPRDARVVALETLTEALHDGDGHPHFTSVLVCGTGDDRREVTELLGMRAVGCGWLVLTDTGAPGVTNRLRVAADSLRQAINAASPWGRGIAGRTRSLREALAAREPSVTQPGVGLLITIKQAHTLPPDELVELCETIQQSPTISGEMLCGCSPATTSSTTA